MVENNDSRIKINLTFNIILAVYLLLSLVIEYLSSPETFAKTPWDILFAKSPVLASISLLFTGIILFVIGIYIVLTFWNRFVTDVFKTRCINVHEAIAILLLLSLVS